MLRVDLVEQRTGSEYGTAGSEESCKHKHTINVELSTRFQCFTCPGGNCKPPAVATAAGAAAAGGDAGSSKGVAAAAADKADVASVCASSVLAVRQ
jgi:hypothetical protein